MIPLSQSLEQVEALLREATGVALSPEPRNTFSLIVQAHTHVALQLAGLRKAEAIAERAQHHAQGGIVQ